MNRHHTALTPVMDCHESGIAQLRYFPRLSSPHAAPAKKSWQRNQDLTLHDRWHKGMEIGPNRFPSFLEVCRPTIRGTEMQ